MIGEHNTRFGLIFIFICLFVFCFQNKTIGQVNAAEDYYKKGNLSFENGDFQSAVNLYSHSIKEDKSNAIVFFNRGIAYTKLHAYMLALNDFDTALKFHPNNYDFLFNKGIALMNIADFSNAKSIFEKISVESDLYRSKSFYYLAIVQKEKGDMNLALENINKAIAKEPNNDLYHLKKGEFYFLLDNFANAINALGKSVEINRQNHRAYFYLALCHHKQKEINQALNFLNKAIILFDKDAEYFYYRSGLFLELNEYSQSLNDMNTAISLNSKNAEYYLARAKLYLNKDNKTNACRDLKAAKRLGVEEAINLYNEICKDIWEK